MAHAMAPLVVPPPPWDSTIEAVLWWQRSGPAVRAALPAPLQGSAVLGITIGGLISYRTGPVGPYRELFAAPLLLRRGRLVAHVALMAVDSTASIAGGRRNWALPKELAGFEADPARPERTTVSGDGWSTAVATSVRRRRVPSWAPFACVQAFPDGAGRSFVVSMC